MTFEQFFKTATGYAPYDYQCRLAGGESGQPCASQLINVPTGLGKTAAVVLVWLWNRLGPSPNSQPSAHQNARAQRFPQHQAITARILEGCFSKIARHERFEFLWRTLRAGAHAAALEWNKLPHRANGTGFSFRRIARRPPAGPRHHRIASGRRPPDLGSELAPGNEGGRRTGCLVRHWITAGVVSGFPFVGNRFDRTPPKRCFVLKIGPVGPRQESFVAHRISIWGGKRMNVK